MEGTLRYRILVPVMVIILQILIVHNTSEPDILDVKNSEMQSDTPSNSTNFTSSGDSGLVISGEPAYVGDTLTASLMVTNNGKSSGSVSLQIRHSDGEQIFQGEYISISPGSTREVSTSFIMELPGTNEFNWQLSVLGQTGQSNLKGNLSIQVSNSQILNITADSIFWSASEGLEIDVSVFLSEGKARPILLAVSSEVAGGNENLQEILLEANPGRRVIEFFFRKSKDNRDYHSGNSGTMDFIYLFSEHYNRICCCPLYRSIIHQIGSYFQSRKTLSRKSSFGYSYT